MSGFRDIFMRNPKIADQAIALMSTRKSLEDKIREREKNFTFDEMALYLLTRKDTLMTSDIEMMISRESVIKKIIEINQIFFFDLTLENITENEIYILMVLAQKQDLQFNALFTSIFTEISPFFTGISEFYESLRSKLPNIFIFIRNNRDLLHLFLFKSFRVLEDCSNLLVSSNILKKQPKAKPFSDVSFFLSAIMPQVRKEDMSREFLRFQLQYLLQMKNIGIPDFYKENFLTNPAPESFYTTVIPTYIQELLSLNGGDVKNVLNEIDPDLRQSFVCDVIRWGLNLRSVSDYNERSKYVDTAFRKSGLEGDTIDIILSLSLEYLTFCRERKEDENAVQTLFSVIKLFQESFANAYLSFIENFASENQVFAEGIAKAQMRITKRKLKFRKLKLPAVEQEAAKINITKELDAMAKKLKWGGKNNLDISNFLNSLDPIFGNIKFYPPFDMSEDMRHIIETDARILKLIVQKFPVFFQFYVMNYPKNSNEASELANAILETNPQALANCFHTLIPIVPEVVGVISAVSDKLEDVVDVSEIIRIASHHCTILEIQQLMQKPFFTPPGDATANLLKASAKWHRIAQTSFWFLLGLAYDKKHKKYITEALAEAAIQLSAIGRTMCVQLMITSCPSHETIYFVKQTLQKTEIWKKECIRILEFWGRDEQSFIEIFRKRKNDCQEIAKYITPEIKLTQKEKEFFFV